MTSDGEFDHGGRGEGEQLIGETRNNWRRLRSCCDLWGRVNDAANGGWEACDNTL